jgi:four helix bundle protein
MINSYKDLLVWQKAMDLAVEVYTYTKTFTKEELYGIVSQMRRAAISVPSNIAEGYSRHRKAEYIHFLEIAYASASELETQLILSYRISFVQKSDFELQNERTQEVIRMLHSLIEKIKISPSHT